MHFYPNSEYPSKNESGTDFPPSSIFNVKAKDGDGNTQTIDHGVEYWTFFILKEKSSGCLH